MGTSVILLSPLLGLIAALLVPRRLVPKVASVCALVPVAVVAVFVTRYQLGYDIQQVTTRSWIAELGINFKLGLDGLNLFLIALSALAWPIATYSARRIEWDRARMFFALLALAQVATFGAFLAQDLILFVLFFDLVLVPFYFLIGIWGVDRRADHVTARGATLKFMIYTLVGSLLMLAAAVAVGTSAPGSTPVFDIAELSRISFDPTTQRWLFIGFALAFLIKMPAFPFHGWMPDAYRAAPLPVLLVFSAVISKLGAFGFLRVVLPILPDAARDFQDVMVVIGIAGILYGSVMAFTQTNVRMIVGYSSIAQLGFITVGIFSLDQLGVQGAIFQMVNHGLVVIALFVVIGLLAERMSGTESVDEMGGLAANAPLLATLFLAATLATLAMPGSFNFVGELYILFGVLNYSIMAGVVASIGVALAAMYAVRMFQRTMHNRTPGEPRLALAPPTGAAPQEPADRPRDLTVDDFLLLAPTVVVILYLAIAPQIVVDRVSPFSHRTVDLVSQSRSVKAVFPETPQSNPKLYEQEQLNR